MQCLAVSVLQDEDLGLVFLFVLMCLDMHCSTLGDFSHPSGLYFFFSILLMFRFLEIYFPEFPVI